VHGLVQRHRRILTAIASATIRIDRSRSSCGYFLGAGTTPPPGEIRPRIEPGAVQFAFSEGFYTPRWRHSRLDHLSPADYEKAYWAGHQPAPPHDPSHHTATV
jgi:transposase InsO family protein